MGRVRVVDSGEGQLLTSVSAVEAKDANMLVHQLRLMFVPDAVVGAQPDVVALCLFDSEGDDRAVLLTCYPRCVHSLRHSVTTFVFSFLF